MAARRNVTGDLEKLQGTWRIVSMQTGPELLADLPPDATITVKGEAFKAAGMGEDYEGTIALDAGKSPRAIDLHFTTGPEKGNTNAGIYEFDDDRWRLCLAIQGTRRPRSFSPRAACVVLEVLERAGSRLLAATAKRASSPLANASADAVAAGPATAIEGQWQMTSAVFSGAPMDTQMVAWASRVTTGNITTVTAGPQVMLKATFTLDPSTAPRSIDYVNVAGANKGRKQAGIYELKGKTLRICMAAPGKPRPAEFASAKGDGRSFTTWTRK